MKNRMRQHLARMNEHIESVVPNAVHNKKVLEFLRDLGPQGTWLGSRTLEEETLEYAWALEASTSLARCGIYQKTGKGGGLMKCPHHGCHLAGRPDLVIGLAAAWLEDKEADHQYLVGGTVFQMPDLNTRHDALFFGSDFIIVLPGRLGTWHELYDLLNRLKHFLLAKVPVYFVERDAYFTNKMKFSTSRINRVLGPRVTAADYESAKIVDMTKTSPAEFVQMVLKDINFEAISSVKLIGAVKHRRKRRA